jgi:WD40 repeat protein
MVLTSEDQLTHIFSLELDPKTGRAASSLRQLTSDSSLVHDRLFPRLSPDGTVLAYVSKRSGSQELMLKNLVSGTESSLGALPRQESLPLVSGDQTLLVYGIAGEPQAVYAVDPAKPFAQRICNRCGPVLDWSRDGQSVLLEAPSRRSLELWEPSGGLRRELIDYPAGTLVQATLAADRKWVTVVFSPPGEAFVVPVSAAAVPREKWIPIVTGSDLSSLRWSPDGAFLYFFARLDDYRCLWAVRLDPATRRPAGAPFSIQHFHSNRLAPWGSWISVGSGRMVFGLTEPRSNVWLATLGNPPSGAPGAPLR